MRFYFWQCPSTKEQRSNNQLGIFHTKSFLINDNNNGSYLIKFWFIHFCTEMRKSGESWQFSIHFSKRHGKTCDNDGDCSYTSILSKIFRLKLSTTVSMTFWSLSFAESKIIFTYALIAASFDGREFNILSKDKTSCRRTNGDWSMNSCLNSWLNGQNVIECNIW